MIDGHPLLAGHECETGAEFENEAFNFSKYGGFEILFRIGVLETEEVENLGIPKDQVGRHAIFVPEFLDFHGGELFGLL